MSIVNQVEEIKQDNKRLESEVSKLAIDTSWLL